MCRNPVREPNQVSVHHAPSNVAASSTSPQVGVENGGSRHPRARRPRLIKSCQTPVQADGAMNRRQGTNRAGETEGGSEWSVVCRTPMGSAAEDG